MPRPVAFNEIAANDAFAELRGIMAREGIVTRGIERDERLIAIGVIDPDGRATIPDHPTLRLVIDPQHGPDEDELAALLRELVDAARSLGAQRLTIGWDPMDFAGLKRLEAAGFRAAGSLPYFETGGGHVEYVTGYQDATGSVMDMVMELRGRDGEKVKK